MLTLQTLTDPDAVNRILSDPWIAPKLAQDGREPGYVNHPLVSYHGAYIDGTLVGLFIAVQFTRWEVEVHAALLRPALPHARDLGRLFLAQVFRDSGVMRVTAYVLGTLPSAANYCRKLGLVDEGVRRSATMVGGKATDVLVLGLVRSEALPSGSKSGPC